MNWHRSGPLGETAKERKERLAREHREHVDRLQRKQLGHAEPRREERGESTPLQRVLDAIDRLARGEPLKLA